FGNFCVASVLGSSCTTCTLRSCAPYAPINSSKYLCFEGSYCRRLRIFRVFFRLWIWIWIWICF
ncbi:MAG: hypothetical protein LBJ16_03065, partial [Holosporaceae bacterium]|nr:hypothetical protein [Holosporaceae bacterium]